VADLRVGRRRGGQPEHRHRHGRGHALRRALDPRGAGERAYTILPLANGATATSFNGVNGVMGELRGAFVFFDDQILLTYTSDDGHFHGCESLRMLDEDRYETRGALFRDGGHVSSWSYTLQRA
jgi:hypothetical protein